MFEAASVGWLPPYSGAAPIFELLAAGKIGFKIESWEVKPGHGSRMITMEIWRGIKNVEKVKVNVEKVKVERPGKKYGKG